MVRAGFSYKYDPFGDILVADDTDGSGVVDENPFRFSSKYHDETGLVYFGFRHYSPRLGRWPSRDPIRETGGLNLYGFAENVPINEVELLGLSVVTTVKGEWVIRRDDGKLFAFAATCAGTIDNLAKTLKLDTSDHAKWLTATDGQPLPAPTKLVERWRIFKIPNTVYIDLGQDAWYDRPPWHRAGGVGNMKESALYAGDRWRERGFHVVVNNFSGRGFLRRQTIIHHLAGAETTMYVYAGHSDTATINTIGGGGWEGVAPGPYSTHGLALVALLTCHSADKDVVKQAFSNRFPYTLNLWEHNVSTRGRFIGFVGSVGKSDWRERMRVVPGIGIK